MHRRPGPEAQVCHGDLGGRSRGRTKRVRAEPAPCWAGATEGRAAGAAARSTRKRARGPEGEPRWGRQGRRRGGGGGGGGASALWRQRQPWGRSGGWRCCGDGREAVAEETHHCPHGQSQRSRLIHSRLGGVGGRP